MVQITAIGVVAAAVMAVEELTPLNQLDGAEASLAAGQLVKRVVGPAF